MVGSRQKDPALLVNRRGGRARKFEIDAVAPELAPAPPDGVGANAKRVWKRYWSSWVAGAVQLDADWDALEQWIRNVDERDKAKAAIKRQPLVLGSRGNLVPNPLYKVVIQLNREIQQAREHFGMTPLSRWRLQLVASEAGRSKVSLERALRSRDKATPAPRDEPHIIDLDAE